MPPALQLSAIQSYHPQQRVTVAQQGLLKAVPLPLNRQTEKLCQVAQSLRLAGEVADGAERLHGQQALLDVGGVVSVDE